MLKADHLLFMSGIQPRPGGVDYLGVGNMMYAPELPVRPPALFVVVSLVPDGKAVINKKLHVKLAAVIDDEEAFTYEQTTDPLYVEKDANWLFVESLMNHTFPKFGVYTVRFYVDDKLLIERPFYVRDVHDLIEP